VFTAGWTREAARFNPASIAGTTEQLRRLTQLGIQLRHSVIAFTYNGDPGLSDDDRDLFWDAFGVPSFEEHLGLTNELLAMECEAHAGLHVMGDFDYLHLDRNSCACGNPAPRFPKRPRIAELVDMLA